MAQKCHLPIRPRQGSLFTGLIAYLTGDLTELRNICRDFPADSQFIEHVQMRLSIRQQSMDRQEIIDFVTAVENTSEEAKGEAYFIAGYASYTIRDFENAIGYYQMALPLLRNIGAFKKALKCAQNIVATKTLINPEMKCIPEYQSIYREAKRLRDHASCGLSLMNISREYQKIGALNIAMDTINLALTYFQKDYGTLHFYLSLAHRAHLHLELGSQKEAILDIERCMTCDFPEVHQAIRVLEKIDLKSTDQDHKFLNPTWAARAKNHLSELRELKFDGLESKLLNILRKGPQSRIDIAINLYGEQIDFESAENRVKNLILRIRKKAPHLIGLKDSRYFITDSQKKSS